jgi:hypothetical protein
VSLPAESDILEVGSAWVADHPAGLTEIITSSCDDSEETPVLGDAFELLLAGVFECET